MMCKCNSIQEICSIHKSRAEKIREEVYLDWYTKDRHRAWREDMIDYRPEFDVEGWYQTYNEQIEIEYDWTIKEWAIATITIITILILI